MPSQVTNYKCLACGGPLHFDGASGKLQCDYCGSSYEVAEIAEKYANEENKAIEAKKQADHKQNETIQSSQADDSDETTTEWDLDGAGSEWGAEADGMKVYNCPSCGAELFCDETTAATSCPYCGNPSIVPGQFSGTKRPDYVIPFKLDKKAAINALKDHYKGKFLLPKAFTAENHVEEIKGVYVPFWLFDADASAKVHFHGTHTHTYKRGDYRITDTKHYDIYRSGKVEFQRVPVDGSSKMPDDYMDSIEPFDYGALKEYSSAYLPGFLADKYDVDAKEASKRADKRCESSAVDCMRDTVHGYETVAVKSSHVYLNRGSVKYALLPVWMLSTKWNGKNYLFAMNGQTGKFVGDLPADKGKLWGVFWGIAASLSVLLSIFLSGPLGGFIAGMIS